MQVQLEQVRQKPFRWDEVQEIAAERLGRSGLIGLGQVAWHGEVRYAAPGFHLRASLAYRQTLQCVRCLQPLTRDTKSEIELMVYIQRAEASPGEHELDASDFGVLFLDTDILDLDPLLLEQLQLDVPMHETCSEQCKGLCPVCGADRNRSECDCEADAVDPRWSGLAGLRDELDG